MATRIQKVMKKSVFLIIALLLILNSCKKGCTPFDRDLLCWLPNSINDTLTFINNQNDTVLFLVSDKYIHDDDNKYGIWDKCQCGSYAGIDALSLTNSEDKIYERIFNSDVKNIGLIYSIMLNGKRGEFVLSTTDINKIVTASIEIENHIYKNVIIMTRDTIEHPNLSGFWKVIISQDIGIVKFYETGNSNIWTLN